MGKNSKSLDFMRSLSAKEKADLFDEIAGFYYNANFGTFSKSQMDLHMFSIYLDKLIDKKKSFDDYTVSKQLGILQSNVRQLKKKKQLIYPRDYKWYKEFLVYSENATYDGSGRIVISIPDPNVYIELQHAIEERGGYVEVQLNSKLLKIPPGYYIDLLIYIHQLDSNLNEKTAEKFRKDFIKELNNRYRKQEQYHEDLTEKTMLTKLKGIGLEIALETLKEVIPGGEVAKGILSLCKTLFNK